MPEDLSAYSDMAESPKPVEGVTCIYVVGGREVIRKTVAAKNHPGMDSFEVGEYKHEEKGTKMVFSWDHLNAKGEHVFFGVKVRT